MYCFFIFYLAIQSCWASYGIHRGYSQQPSPAKSGYPSSSNYSSSSSGMPLNLPRIDVKIANFISSAEEMERKQRYSDVQIPQNWYKLDEHKKEIEGPNYQNHILEILIKELIDQFQEVESERSVVIEESLKFINKFISERFIPGAYHQAIRDLFNYTFDLQQKPPICATKIIFDSLSEDAKKDFEEGIRVQVSGISRSPSASIRAEPTLVELLLLQLVWDAQRKSKTNQELLNAIDKDMTRLEQLFGNDSSYTIVGSFPSLRAELLEKAQTESPIPDVIRYIINFLIKGLKEKAELKEKYEEVIIDKELDEWKQLTSKTAKIPVSIWQDVQLESEEEKADRLEREREKKEEKARKKADRLKKIHGKGKIKETANGLLESGKEQAISAGKNSVSKIFGGVINKLQGLFSF